MTVRLVKAYFVRGTMPSGQRARFEVSDPPTCGWGHVVVVPGEKRSTMLSPFTLGSWRVSNACEEMRSAVDVECPAETLAEYITKAWQDGIALGLQRDYGVAAMVLTALGQCVPKFLPSAEAENREEKLGGKPINPEALRPCKASSKRGEVAAFFLQPSPQSLHEAMARLDLTRSGVLSHLFVLNKSHGVGYELAHDCARLIAPPGFDLFCDPEPTPRLDGAGLAPEAKRRTGGKPILPEALKPIPEPGRRASVARLFVDGFFSLAEAMALLKLDRSAVLSHLYTIHKSNGLGYELSPDSLRARLVVPDGHAVFVSKAGFAASE